MRVRKLDPGLRTPTETELRRVAELQLGGAGLDGATFALIARRFGIARAVQMFVELPDGMLSTPALVDLIRIMGLFATDRSTMELVAFEQLYEATDAPAEVLDGMRAAIEDLRLQRRQDLPPITSTDLATLEVMYSLEMGDDDAGPTLSADLCWELAIDALDELSSKNGQERAY